MMKTTEILHRYENEYGKYHFDNPWKKFPSWGSFHLSCLFGFHDWHYCHCKKCGKNRRKKHKLKYHDSNNCRCELCLTNSTHSWDGCKCSLCGGTRDIGHEWKGCICTICGKNRNDDSTEVTADKFHNWTENWKICSVCGKERNIEEIKFFDFLEFPNLVLLLNKIKSKNIFYLNDRLELEHRWKYYLVLRGHCKGFNFAILSEDSESPEIARNVKFRIELDIDWRTKNNMSKHEFREKVRTFISQLQSDSIDKTLLNDLEISGISERKKASVKSLSPLFCPHDHGPLKLVSFSKGEFTYKCDKCDFIQNNALKKTLIKLKKSTPPTTIQKETIFGQCSENRKSRECDIELTLGAINRWIYENAANRVSVETNENPITFLKLYSGGIGWEKCLIITISEGDKNTYVLEGGGWTKDYDFGP